MDKSELAKLEAQFRDAGRRGEAEFKRAMITARRATGTESKRSVAASYNLRQRRIDQGLYVASAADGLGFTVTGNRKPISFASYGARALKRGGISVRITKGKTSRFVNGFAATAPSGAALFWVRTGEAPRRMQAGRYVGRVREPIKPLFGPSIADTLNNDEVRARIDARFFTVYERDMVARLKRLLGEGSK